MNIYTEMTLIREPSESPFIIGMEDQLSKETDDFKIEMIQNKINEYIAELNHYYNKPERSIFTYTIAIDNNNYKLFYRTTTFDEVLLTDVNKLSEVEDSEVVRESGRITAENIGNESQSKALLTSFTYDRIDA